MNPPPVRERVRLDALAIADGDGFCASPGSLLIERGAAAHGPLVRLLAAGEIADVARHPAADGARVVSRPGDILIPGLVNAHTHLDLTHIGPQPHDAAGGAGFLGWVDMIRQRRATTPEAIRASVRRGVELCRAGGTVAVGDIAGAPQARPTLAAFEALRESPMLGVSFLEFFAIGGMRDRSIAAVAQALADAAAAPAASPSGIALGLQPHAPTTVSLDAFRWAVAAAAERGLPLSTHLAETPEEREFIARGTGPQREFFERLGIWSAEAAAAVGHGQHPVAHVAEILAEASRLGRPFLVAHVNDADDAAIETLARTGTTVAYCPRASAYFGAQRHFGPHRYRDMLDAGVRVAIGTDSLVNLPPSAAETDDGGMSPLDEVRFLYRRDGTDPVTLLRMATINGAKGLGLDPDWFRFGPARRDEPSLVAGVVAVPVDVPGAGQVANPHEAVMRGTKQGELL